MNCPHWTDEGKRGGGCALGLYGGHRISAGTCLKCIAVGENNAEHAESVKISKAASGFKVTFRKKGCAPCKPVTVVY